MNSKYLLVPIMNKNILYRIPLPNVSNQLIQNFDHNFTGRINNVVNLSDITDLNSELFFITTKSQRFFLYDFSLG